MRQTFHNEAFVFFLQDSTRSNLKRNEIGVKPMRNLWGKRIGGKMTEEEFTKAIADIDRVIALYDEKIFTIRQPQKHVYEIRRLAAGKAEPVGR